MWRSEDLRGRLRGPVYFMLHDVRSQDRARELVAVSHAPLYGDLEPIKRAVPDADLICPRTP